MAWAAPHAPDMQGGEPVLHDHPAGAAWASPRLQASLWIPALMGFTDKCKAFLGSLANCYR